MRKSLEELLGRPVHFPAKITLSSGEKYLLPHPDYAHAHPHMDALVIYPKEGPFLLILNLDQIVSFETVKLAS